MARTWNNAPHRGSRALNARGTHKGPSCRVLAALIVMSFVGTAATTAATTIGAQDAQWISQFGTAEQESGTQVAADGAGGTFAGTNSGPQIFGTTDVILAHYSAAGQLTWTQTIGSAGRDELWSAASDGAGGFLVGGSTSGSLGGPLLGSSDAWIGRFDAAGTQIWLTQLGTASYDACLSVVSDGAGGAFACGSTQGDLIGTAGGGNDAWLARLDSTGAVSWLRQLNSGASDSATGLDSDGTGGLYVCGRTSGDLYGIGAGDPDAWLARFDAAGNTQWGLQWGSGDREDSVRVGRNGTDGVFVAGNTVGLLGATSAGGSDIWVTRVDELGSQSWIRQFGTPDSDQCTAVVSDLSGGFYLSGSTSGVLGAGAAGGLDPWFARYDGDGDRSWLRQFGTPEVDRAGGLSVYQPGQLFFGGSTGLELSGVNQGQEDAWVASFNSLISTNYCSSPANSTGEPARIVATGSSAIQLNRLTIRGESLPRLVFGFFIISLDQGFAANPGGSQGNLCLGGAIGRFVGPGQVQNSGTGGVISLELDLSALPQPLGFVPAQPGESWNFQAWYRDGNPLSTSNFTDGVEITFL